MSEYSCPGFILVQIIFLFLLGPVSPFSFPLKSNIGVRGGVGVGGGMQPRKLDCRVMSLGTTDWRGIIKLGGFIRLSVSMCRVKKKRSCDAMHRTVLHCTASYAAVLYLLKLCRLASILSCTWFMLNSSSVTKAPFLPVHEVDLWVPASAQ